jgi:glycosyltransferase involved in cell wall biosynthesis
VLHNGIENKFFNSFNKSEIESIRAKIIPFYSKKTGTIYISVANFVPYKDFFTVLEALRLLMNKKKFYYIIIGDGPMRGRIEKTIKDFGLGSKVSIVGISENVRDYLFISDIMIHSSRGEGISNSILEGMYAGLPVIATNVGGIPETVYHGSSMLFPYKDDKALLECLLKADEVFASFNKDSKEYKKHLAKFSVNTMVKKLEEIISIVMQNQSDLIENKEQKVN